jgi:hypothetical protein
LEHLEKEEKKINEKIESLKNINNNLLSEIKVLHQNLTNIKFENLCLKEKLDKFSNGNSNEYDILDGENININMNINSNSNVNTNAIANEGLNNIYYEEKNQFLNGKTTSKKNIYNLI